MGLKILDSPWSIQIELTFGCNRKCKFCFKQVLNNSKRKFMSIKTTQKVAMELKVFDPTILKFAMRGEPLLNKNWLDIIGIFHENMPKSKILVTTNGDALTVDKIKNFYDVGGNILLVDCYNGTLEERKNKFKMLKPINSPEEKDRVYDLNINEKKLFLIDDILEESSSTRKLSNLAGNMSEEMIKKFGLDVKEPLNRYCTRPFGEMIIFYNGDVGYCCHDGEAKYILWNINKGNMDFFWKNNYLLKQIRYHLIDSNRNIALCKYCDYFGGDINRLEGIKN